MWHSELKINSKIKSPLLHHFCRYSSVALLSFSHYVAFDEVLNTSTSPFTNTICGQKEPSGSKKTNSTDLAITNETVWLLLSLQHPVEVGYRLHQLATEHSVQQSHGWSSFLLITEKYKPQSTKKCDIHSSSWLHCSCW